MKRMLGLLGHFVLGAVFPYVLGGVIVLLTGIDAPSGTTDQLRGLFIAAVYLMLLAGLNFYALRGPARLSARRAAALHAIVWITAAAVSLMLLRL